MEEFKEILNSKMTYQLYYEIPQNIQKIEKYFKNIDSLDVYFSELFNEIIFSINKIHKESLNTYYHKIKTKYNNLVNQLEKFKLFKFIEGFDKYTNIFDNPYSLNNIDNHICNFHNFLEYIVDYINNP